MILIRRKIRHVHDNGDNNFARSKTQTMEGPDSEGIDSNSRVGRGKEKAMRRIQSEYQSDIIQISVLLCVPSRGLSHALCFGHAWF